MVAGDNPPAEQQPMPKPNIIDQVRDRLIARRNADRDARPRRPLWNWGAIATRAAVRRRVVERFAEGESLPRVDHLLAIAEAIGCRITIKWDGTSGAQP